MDEITLVLPLEVVHTMSRFADQALLGEIDIDKMNAKIFPNEQGKLRRIFNAFQEKASPALALSDSGRLN